MKELAELKANLDPNDSYEAFEIWMLSNGFEDVVIQEHPESSRLNEAIEKYKKEKSMKNITKPKPEDFGWHTQSGFDDLPSGWMYEGSEEAYDKALKKWEIGRGLNENQNFITKE